MAACVMWRFLRTLTSECGHSIATHSSPKKRNEGQLNLAVHFAGVEFNPGQYFYADKNGMVVARAKLNLERS